MNASHVAFDTDLFRNEQPDEEIDQWFLGEDLAKWLHHELIRHDNITSTFEPIEEDWGWTFGVRVSDTRFRINIWNLHTWIVGLEVKPGLLGVFHKARTAIAVTALQSMVDQMLATADFKNVEWYDHWPHERLSARSQ